MKYKERRRFKIRYLAFCIPLILAYISWAFFPLFVQWVINSIFRYDVVKTGSWIWLGMVRFFYGWYTFLAIGIAGMWAVAASFARTEPEEAHKGRSPMVSFVVPAYNEERNVSGCVTSLFRNAEKYRGSCEVIIVDDGSGDFTYEVAWSSLEFNRRLLPQVRGKVVRHSANLGKVEAIRTGVNAALGGLIVIVDGDSCWLPDTLSRLVSYMLLNGKKAVTGYVHPSDGDSELNPYVVLQQLEYSQGLGLNRCAMSLGNNVLVVSGAIGLFDAEVLRGILNGKSVCSVTEDLEITLEMHKKGAGVGYVNVAASSTIVPTSFNVLWNQRLRWFAGWLHNTLNIHKDLMLRKSWLTVFLWYCYIFEYGGAVLDLVALVSTPFLFWFAPDRIYFVLNALVFVPYGLLVGVINQAIALKYAYDRHNYKSLLFYTPFYPILRLVNVFARLISSVKYLSGDHGVWKNLVKN